MSFHGGRLGERIAESEVSEEEFNRILIGLRIRREECGDDHKKEVVDSVRGELTYCYCDYCETKYVRPYREGDLDKDVEYAFLDNFLREIP